MKHLKYLLSGLTVLAKIAFGILAVAVGGILIGLSCLLMVYHPLLGAPLILLAWAYFLGWIIREP